MRKFVDVLILSPLEWFGKVILFLDKTGELLALLGLATVFVLGTVGYILCLDYQINPVLPLIIIGILIFCGVIFWRIKKKKTWCFLSGFFWNVKLKNNISFLNFYKTKILIILRITIPFYYFSFNYEIFSTLVIC